MLRDFDVQTERKTQVLDVTREVRAALDGSEERSAALVYVPHTTAGIVIQENSDPSVKRDLERSLERIVDDGWGWEHVEAGEENGASHVRAALMASSVVIPLRDGELTLGTWQGIFFLELDGPRRRTVYVTTLG